MKATFDYNIALRLLSLYLVVDFGTLALTVFLGWNWILLFSVVSAEGLITLIFGLFLIFSSLFSSWERYEYEYVGDGMKSRRMKRMEISEEERIAIRAKGLTLVAVGLSALGVGIVVLRVVSF